MRSGSPAFAPGRRRQDVAFTRPAHAIRHPEASADAQELAGLAARLRPAFERPGTTFIKLGQLIASADGMLPEGRR